MPCVVHEGYGPTGNRPTLLSCPLYPKDLFQPSTVPERLLTPELSTDSETLLNCGCAGRGGGKLGSSRDVFTQSQEWRRGPRLPCVPGTLSTRARAGVLVFIRFGNFFRSGPNVGLRRPPLVTCSNIDRRYARIRKLGLRNLQIDDYLMLSAAVSSLIQRLRIDSVS
jgi:hypothetical protein